MPLPSNSPSDNQRNMKMLPVNGSTPLWYPIQCSIRHQAHHQPRSGEPMDRFPGISAVKTRPLQPIGRGENHLRLISWKDKHNNDLFYKPISIDHFWLEHVQTAKPSQKFKAYTGGFRKNHAAQPDGPEWKEHGRFKEAEALLHTATEGIINRILNEESNF